MSAEASKSQIDDTNALPPGTRLGEFELLRKLGVGGFGIVYLAFDHALEREVAVKEYMPATLVGRTETMHVSLLSQSDAETFALGLRSFVNEARLLARFDHPSLLKVHRYWEANGTAYMAMPVMRGRTIKEVRLDMSVAPNEAWLRALLDPLLGAIEKLHSEGVYHRDIAPDNIQVEPDGHPVLLDFGAARRVLSDKSQALTAILKPAYAPIEQYAEAGSVKQGPWTDLYALGATLHYLLLGRPPPPATARTVHDEASALTTLALPGCSENFLLIVDWMLAPRPVDRPQNVAALRDALQGRTQPPRPQPQRPVETPEQWDRTVLLRPPGAAARTPVSDVYDEQATIRVPPPKSAAAQTPGQTPGQLQAVRVRSPLSLPPVAAAPSPMPAVAGRNKLLPVGLGLGLGVLVLVLAAMLWPRQPAPMPAPAAPEVIESAGLAAPLSQVPVSPLPESTLTTVVVPGAPGAFTTATTTAPTTAPTPAAATVLAALPSADPATVPSMTTTPLRPAAPARAEPAPLALPTPPPVPARAAPAAKPAAAAQRQAAATLQPQAGAAAAAPTPHGWESPRGRGDAPAVAPVSALSYPPAAAEAARPVVVGPESLCSERSGMTRFMCMERACLRSEFTAHADCQKWRQNARHD